MQNLQRMLKDIDAEVNFTRSLIGKGALDKRVIEALKQVPRHMFISDELKGYAYENGPVPIGFGQTISQPFIVALMSDLLQTKPTDTVLEIGTGSGYQSAVLSHLVQQVYSIEIIDHLAINARELLQKLHYHNVSVRNGDGYSGWSEYAPFDGIIVTAAAPHLPQALIDQLKLGARLVIPVGLPFSDQELLVIEKKANDQIETHDVLGVSFVPLTGQCDEIKPDKA